MKLVFILLLTTLVSYSTFAAEGTKFGMGFSYSAGEGVQTIFNRPKLLAPIVMNNLRIEPELGLFRNSYTSEYDEDSRSENILLLDVAIGLYFVSEVNDKINLFNGGKIGGIVGFGSKGYDNALDDSNFFYVGISTGIEYKILPELSISGEIGLNYSRFSNSGDYHTDSSDFILTTSTISVRWFY